MPWGSIMNQTTTFPNSTLLNPGSINGGNGESYTMTGMLLMTTYGIIFLLGVSGNALVLHFYWQKTRRSLFDLYVIHLALADLLSSLVTPAFFIQQEITSKSGTTNLSAPLCAAMNVIGPITVNVSSWILTSIAHERYRGIVQPFKTRFTRNRIHMQVGIIWILTLGLYTPYILAMDKTSGKCSVKWDSYKKELAYNIAILLLQSIFPIVLMSYWFVIIASVLNGAERKQLFTSAETSNNSRSASKKGKRLTLLLLVAVIVFVVCSLPYNVFYVVAIYVVFYGKATASVTSTIIDINPWLAALTMSSCITNALVYGGMHAEFRQFLRDRFSTLSLRRRDSGLTSSSTDPPLQSTGVSSKFNPHETQL